MNSQANLLRVYKELASVYQQRGQAQMRDRFLILAADAALSSGLAGEAEQFRQRLLQANPNHMVKPYSTFSQARESPDVDTYVRNLRLNYPQDVAEDLLRALQKSNDATLHQAGPSEPLTGGNFDDQTLRLDNGPKDPTYPLTDEPTLRHNESQPSPNFGGDDYDIGKTAAIPFSPGGRNSLPSPGNSPSPTRSSSLPASRPPTKRAPATSPAVPFGNDSAKGKVKKPGPMTANRENSGDAENGKWMGMVLTGFVVLAGLAAAAFTIGRPFLDRWLR